MLDFINIALRTIMCLAFIAFVVRPMLLSMVRREPNTLELEEMAQLAVNSAFKEQFVEFYAKKPVLQLESSADKQVIESSAAPAVKIAVKPVVLTKQEQLALEVENARLAELVKGHEEEMARRAELAAKESERLAKVAQEALALGELIEAEEEGDSSLEKMRQTMKKEKKKPAIPAELLAGNSYEDKLMVVRYVTEQEQNRVAHAIRSMIKIGP
jgi:exonuclease I